MLRRRAAHLSCASISRPSHALGGSAADGAREEEGIQECIDVDGVQPAR